MYDVTGGVSATILRSGVLCGVLLLWPKCQSPHAYQLTAGWRALHHGFSFFIARPYPCTEYLRLPPLISNVGEGQHRQLPQGCRAFPWAAVHQTRACRCAPRPGQRAGSVGGHGERRCILQRSNRGRKNARCCISISIWVAAFSSHGRCASSRVDGGFFGAEKSSEI